jgi:hypothetical protein
MLADATHDLGRAEEFSLAQVTLASIPIAVDCE